MGLPIFNKWSAGDLVDYTPEGGVDLRNALSQVNNSGIAGGKLVLGSAAQGAFQQAKERANGAKRRAVIDHIVDENTIRIMLCDTMDILWVRPTELESLDAVSALADTITSKSLKEQLADMDRQEREELSK